MSKVISLTVPDALYTALQAEGKELGHEPGEVLKSGLIIAYKQPEGWHLKLKPAVQPPDPAQIELPLEGGAKP